MILGQKKNPAADVVLPQENVAPGHVTADVPDLKNDSGPDLARKTEPERRNRDELPVRDRESVLESDIAQEGRHRHVLHRKVVGLSDAPGPGIEA